MRLFSLIQVLATLTATSVAVAAQDCPEYTDLTGSSAKVYRTETVWSQGRRAWCYPFSDRNSAVVPLAGNQRLNSKVAYNEVIYVLYPDGTSAGAPLVSHLPCDSGYSDATKKRILKVEFSVKPDSYRDFESLNATSYSQLTDGGFFNLPLVPPGSTLEDISRKHVPEYDLVQAWYKGKKVFFFDFGTVKQDAAYDFIQASAAVEVFADDPYGVPVRNGFTVLSLPVGGAYSGFFTYLSSDTTGAPFNYLHYFTNFTSGVYNYQDRNIILNCPVVEIEDFEYVGNPPAQTKPSIESKPSAEIPPPPPEVDLTIKGNCYDKFLYGPSSDYYTAEAFYESKRFGCWNLGLRSTPAENGTTIGLALQPVYKSGTSAGLIVFGALPCQNKYTDVVRVLNAVVDDNTPFNFFKDFTNLQYSASSTSVVGVYNYPIVEPGSKLSVNPADYRPELAGVPKPLIKDGWYQGQSVSFVDFFKVPDLVPNSETVQNGKAIFPFKFNGQGQNILSGDPVFDSVQGDANYTGLYDVEKVQVSDSTFYNSTEAVDFSKVSSMEKVLNCPHAYFLGFSANEDYGIKYM
ncbi:hypothetical protein HDU96_008209 [Phlyctochytrium bullatum]|nr:hypothetical protein HDU96_008209 [Phlyctochytrium bullatum]